MNIISVYKKIFCQLDSLMRLDTEHGDIVVIDECGKSQYIYITSPHFTNNPKANLMMSSSEYMVSNPKHTYMVTPVHVVVHNHCILSTLCWYKSLKSLPQ